MTALDVLESALEAIRTKAGHLGLENIEMVRANLEIPGGSGLADNSQDLVLLANILFQSDKKQEIISEGVRVLRPAGKLVIIDWRQGGNGMGPPQNLRLSEERARELALAAGLNFENQINAGDFHYGLVFGR